MTLQHLGEAVRDTATEHIAAGGTTSIVMAIAGATLIAVVMYAHSRKSAREALRRERLEKQLAELYGPLLAARNQGMAIWARGSDLVGSERKQYLERVWLPHIAGVDELLGEQAHLRTDEADSEVLARYVGALRAHVAGVGQEPPYPRDVLEEMAAAAELLATTHRELVGEVTARETGPNDLPGDPV